MSNKLKTNEYRYALLKLIYDMSDGKSDDAQLTSNNHTHFAEKLGSSEEDEEAAFNWLCGARLVRQTTHRTFVITHAGVREVEQADQRPDNGTEHFDSTVIHNVTNFYGAVGAVQHGSHNTVNVAQQFNVGNQLADVMNLIEKVRQGAAQLPAGQREDVAEVVDALEEQAKSPAPKKALVKSYAATLNTYLLAYAPVITQIVDMIHSRTT